MANTHSLDLELSSSQFASRADTASLSQTGDISCEGWVKTEQLPSTSGTRFTILSKLGDTGADANKRSYRFAINSSDKLELFWSADGTTSNFDVWDTDADFGSNATWVHVAVALDVSAQSPIFYLNGSSSAGTRVSQAGTATSIHDNNVDFAVGDTPKTATRTFFDGKLNSVRLYGDIRSGAEILANWKTSTPAGNNLAFSGYYNADHNDDSGNSNNLTASGGPVFSTDIPYTEASSNFLAIL